MDVFLQVQDSLCVSICLRRGYWKIRCQHQLLIKNIFIYCKNLSMWTLFTIWKALTSNIIPTLKLVILVSSFISLHSARKWNHLWTAVGLKSIQSVSCWCTPLQVWHESFGMRTDNQSRQLHQLMLAYKLQSCFSAFFRQFFGDFFQQTCKICALCKTSSTQYIQRKENNLLSKSLPKINFLLCISLLLWLMGCLFFCW